MGTSHLKLAALARVLVGMAAARAARRGSLPARTSGTAHYQGTSLVGSAQREGQLSGRHRWRVSGRTEPRTNRVASDGNSAKNKWRRLWAYCIRVASDVGVETWRDWRATDPPNHCGGRTDSQRQAQVRAGAKVAGADAEHPRQIWTSARQRRPRGDLEVKSNGRSAGGTSQVRRHMHAIKISDPDSRDPRSQDPTGTLRAGTGRGVGRKNWGAEFGAGLRSVRVSFL